MSERTQAILIAAFVAFCMLLGGSSRGGALPWLAIELVSVAVLAVVALHRGAAPATTDGRAPRLLLIALAVLMTAYLVPLPPAVWSALPGRSAAAQTFDLLGVARPWLPAALAPHPALASALALLPAFAAYLAIPVAGRRAPGFAAATIVAVAVLSAAIALVQLAAGNRPSQRLWGAKSGEIAGLFANPNHNATLMLMGLVMLAAIAAQFRMDRRRDSQAIVAGYAVFGVAAMILLFGIVLNGSLTGLLLLVPTAVAAIVIYRDGQPGVAPILLGAGATAFVLLASVAAYLTPLPFNYGLGERGTPGIDRITFFRTTARAARDHLPLGSGPGSFQSVYPGYENPAQAGTIFVNHAHDDYLEIALETGVPGLLLLALFLFWWMRRLRTSWAPSEARVPIARGATIATAVVLAHSLIDYPLRTATVMTAFAACCAILSIQHVASVTAAAPPRSRRGARGRHIAA